MLPFLHMSINFPIDASGESKAIFLETSIGVNEKNKYRTYVSSLQYIFSIDFFTF
jgi:hypothetical protein